MYTLRDLTKDYNRQDLSIYINTQTKKISKIENEFGVIYSPKPVDWYDKLIDTDYTYLEADYQPLFREKESKPIEIIIDGEEFMYFNGDIKKQHKQPYMMKNIELYQYFKSLDIATVNMAHYAVTHNLCIERGLINSEKLILSELEYKEEIF